MFNKVNFELRNDEVTIQDSALTNIDLREILPELMTKLDLEQKYEVNLQLQIAFAQELNTLLKITAKIKKNTRVVKLPAVMSNFETSFFKTTIWF